ncbi:MAG: TIGR04388 family protein, partial [Leptospiraceae bacterium]|nr:TIGR04388 family protein [Leptospiraceae bacterium]
LAADILIHAEREVYLKDLIEKQYLETIGQADDIMEQTAAQMPDYMANSGEYSAAEMALREEQYRYEKEIQQSVNRSLYEYQIALAQLEDDRQRYQQELATTDQEFQQTLAQIEQYENQIRTAIEQAVTALEQYIQNSNQFYATTCDGENNCTVDTNTLNAAGQNLDQLIQDLRNGLNTNAPLSQLALQMTQYMEARLTDAQQTRDQWDADIYVTASEYYAEPIFGPADPGIKLSTNGSYSNIYVDHMSGANTQKLKDHLKNGDYREVVNVRNVDVCGFSPSHSPAPITVNSWSTNGCYSNEGLALYSYEITAASPTFWGIWIMWWEGHMEQEVRYYANFELYDQNAEANRDVWQGYVDDIDPMAALWRDDLLPAIENWEAQKATYQANYAAWQAQAQNDTQAMDNHVRTSQELLIRERNAYLNDVEAQIKDDREQFRQAQKRVEEGAADAEVRELLAKTSGATESPGAIHTMLASRIYAPSNAESFLERPKVERPDFSKMEEVYAKFQTGLQGSLQIAQAQNLKSLARDTKTQVLEDVKKQLESTRKIEVTEKEIAAAVQQRIDKLVQKRNESPWEYHAPIDEAEIRKEVTENIRERKERLAW